MMTTNPATTPNRRRRPRDWIRTPEARFALALMAPAAIFLLVFVAWPVIRLVFDSFYDVEFLHPADRTFVGLANYIEAFGSDSVRGAAARTAAYTAIALSFELLLGFGAAILFNAFGKRSEIPRTIFAFPLMIAPVVAGLLWRFLLIDGFGIVNELLARVGILNSPGDISWLSNPDIVLFSVAIPDIWLTSAFVMLITYAGLQNIPQELIEAARVDGARASQIFRRVTLPLLRPVLAVVLIIRGIDAARAFDVILIQTEGGPQSASEVLSLQIYRTMVRFGDLGEASAIATLFLVAMLVLALVAYRTIWRPGTLES